MLGQRLAPGVEHGGDAEFRPQMCRILGKLLQGLRRHLEQEIVERALVDPNQGIERVR